MADSIRRERSGSELWSTVEEVPCLGLYSYAVFIGLMIAVSVRLLYHTHLNLLTRILPLSLIMPIRSCSSAGITMLPSPAYLLFDLSTCVDLKNYYKVIQEKYNC
ncbi:5940_t:CDS:1 [Cetraspora pellucida]|uniref:5940_t:CDS:1 n=1 Tax=Cetraspora pellucida TaxID=1433469 RepID=A0A9N9DZS3_9GLOM|nr:5940_t:CDS:1 [Cetraspora pellucida]